MYAIQGKLDFQGAFFSVAWWDRHFELGEADAILQFEFLDAHEIKQGGGCDRKVVENEKFLLGFQGAG